MTDGTTPGNTGGTGTGTTVTGRQIVRRTLTRNKAALAAGTLLVCLHQVAETAVPLTLGVLIDRGVASKDISALVISIAVLAGLFLVLTAAFRGGMRILNIALQREGHLLRMEVSERALSPRGIDTDLGSDELLTISSSDAEQAAWFLDLFPRIAAAATAVVATAIALLVIDLSLGVAVLVGVPAFLALLRVATPLITRRAVAQQSRVAKATAAAGDLIVGLRSIKGIGAEDAAAKRYARASDSALEATLRTVTSMSVQRGITAAISSLIAAAIAVVAGWYALSGRISTGELIAVAGLAQFLIEPLTMLSATPAVVGKARGSAERVAQVLNAPHLIADGGAAIPPDADVCLSDVGYRSLSSVNLTIPRGSLTAVFAFDRADGEALAHLLSGHLPGDAYTGDVTLGGRSLRDAGRDAVRRHIVAEPHVTDLFAGTVASNIVAGDGNPDQKVLAAALASAAADQVIEQQPAGLAQEITERGQSLSGGQRQRLALARALYAQPPLLVLHEPTTAVDAMTEHQIAAGIASARRPHPRGAGDASTTVVITPSPTLLAVADRVVVLRDGTVQRIGTHAELLATYRDYAEAVSR